MYPVNFLAHFLTKWTLFRLLSFKPFSQRAQIRWPIHIINPVDKSQLSCNSPHQRSTTVSLETYPVYSFSWGIFGHVMYLDQSRASENIWLIINTENLNYFLIGITTSKSILMFLFFQKSIFWRTISLNLISDTILIWIGFKITLIIF